MELGFAFPALEVDVGDVLRVSAREDERGGLDQSRIAVFASCKSAVSSEKASGWSNSR